MGLRLSGFTVLLVSRVRGSMTVCLVSPAMVESTAGVAAVWLPPVLPVPDTLRQFLAFLWYLPCWIR